MDWERVVVSEDYEVDIREVTILVKDKIRFIWIEING